MAPPLPAAADGETQESIVGDITWTRVEGDASTQPRRIDFVVDGEFYGSDVDGVSWRAPDGITWTKVDRFDPVHDVTQAGGATWAVQFEPGARGEWDLVRWDGTSFEPVELPPSRAPTVDGLSSSERRLSLTPFGDRLAVGATEAYSVAWSDFLGAGDWFAVTSGDRTIEVRNVMNGGSVRLDVTVDETEPGRIHLHEDGRLLTSIGPWPGLDAESLTRSLDSLSHNELMIGGSDGFERAELPAVQWRHAQIVELDDRLLVLLQRLGPSDWEFGLWAGGPGVDWERLDLPAPRGALLDHIAIEADGRSAVLTIVSSRPGQVAEAWHTTDGETWQVANGAASFGSVQRADFGWMSENVFEESNSIAVSPDGIVWQQISVALREPERAGGGSVRAIGETIVLSQFVEFGDRTMWIGRVESS